MKKILFLFISLITLTACSSKQAEIDSNQIDVDESGNFVISGTIPEKSALFYVNDQVITSSDIDSDGNFKVNVHLNEPMKEVTFKIDSMGQTVLEEEKIKLNTDAHDKAIAANQKAEDEKQAKEQAEKEKKKQENADAESKRAENDEELKNKLNSLKTEYSNTIVDIRVYDALVDIMINSNFDNLGSNQKQELLTNIGKKVNEIALENGEKEEKDVTFYNTSENKIGSYKRSLLGDFETKLK